MLFPLPKYFSTQPWYIALADRRIDGLVKSPSVRLRRVALHLRRCGVPCKYASLLIFWGRFGGRSLFYSLLSVFIVGVNSFPWTFFAKDISKILFSFRRPSPDQNHRPYGERQVAGGQVLKFSVLRGWGQIVQPVDSSFCPQVFCSFFVDPRLSPDRA